MTAKEKSRVRILPGTKSRRLLPFVFLWCLLWLPAYASALDIQGKVTSNSGEELIGVSILDKKSKKGTTTDMEGHYTISVAEGSELTFSYVGYKSRTVRVKKGGTLDIELEEDSNVLDEVVVIGYGAMKRSDLTGAVSSIDEKAIKQGVNTSVEQAMQGRIAGVQVTQNSGAPGGGISVQIRGINSLNGNEPLYVVDGVAMSGQTSGNLSVLSSINPADITSVEVLKDASATAIYGSRASNGVVLITTRRGQNGKPHVTYNGYVGWQQLPGRIEMMNLPEYAEYYNIRAGIQGWGKREDFEDPSLLTNGTDWQDELFRTAFMHNHQVSVDGGTRNIRYALSGGFLDQDGIGLGSNFRRATFRANFDTDITSWLKIGVNAAYTHHKQITTMDDSGLINTALNQRPDIPAFNPDGSFGFMEKDDNNTYYSNPLFEAMMRENYNTASKFYYNAFVNINPVKGLNLRAEYGGDISRGNSYYFCPDYQYGTVVVESQSTRSSSKNDYWSLKTYATYDIDFLKKNHLQIMAGHEAQHGSWENLSGSRKGFISDAIHNLDVGDATTATNSNGGSAWAIESYFGRINYNFDNRYLLTATIRSDGSSNLGPNNRWGTFPSVALAWRINNENFMKSVNWLSNLKLRLGWGIVGNQNVGTYAYGTTMRNTVTAWGTGYYPGNYSNPDLKWEQTDSYNIGLDMAFLSNRIEFIVDAYLKKTKNLLMQASLPAYIIDSENVGMSAPWVNVGGMENKGIEFTLNATPISNRNVTWSTGLTISVNRNKLTKLYSDDAEIYGKIGDGVYTRSAIGEPVGQYFGYNVIGMFTCEDDFYRRTPDGEFYLDEYGKRVEVARPADSNGNMYPIAENSIWVGDYIFEDVNNDGIINEKDRKYIGDSNPKFTFGFNNVISYRNFTLSFFLNGSVGNKVYNFVRAWHTDPMGYGGKYKEVSQFARVEKIDPAGENMISNVHVTNASSAVVQRVSSAGMNNNDNNRFSSRFVEDGSYLRLKNISLSYDFNRNWLRKAKISSLQLYVNVQNAFTITKYKGYDPEIGASGQNVLLQGIDRGRYPSQRIYTVGLKLEL